MNTRSAPNVSLLPEKTSGVNGGNARINTLPRELMPVRQQAQLMPKLGAARVLSKAEQWATAQFHRNKELLEADAYHERVRAQLDLPESSKPLVYTERRVVNLGEQAANVQRAVNYAPPLQTAPAVPSYQAPPPTAVHQHNQNVAQINPLTHQLSTTSTQQMHQMADAATTHHYAAPQVPQYYDAPTGQNVANAVMAHTPVVTGGNLMLDMPGGFPMPNIMENVTDIPSGEGRAAGGRARKEKKRIQRFVPIPPHREVVERMAGEFEAPLVQMPGGFPIPDIMRNVPDIPSGEGRAAGGKTKKEKEKAKRAEPYEETNAYNRRQQKAFQQRHQRDEQLVQDVAREAQQRAVNEMLAAEYQRNANARAVVEVSPNMEPRRPGRYTGPSIAGLTSAEIAEDAAGERHRRLLDEQERRERGRYAPSLLANALLEPRPRRGSVTTPPRRGSVAANAATSATGAWSRGFARPSDTDTFLNEGFGEIEMTNFEETRPAALANQIRNRPRVNNVLRKKQESVMQTVNNIMRTRKAEGTMKVRLPVIPDNYKYDTRPDAGDRIMSREWFNEGIDDVPIGPMKRGAGRLKKNEAAKKPRLYY